MRTIGAVAKKPQWHLKICQGENVLHDGEYTSIKTAAEAVGLSYCQLAEMHKGRTKCLTSKYAFAPKVEITRINKKCVQA